MEYISIKELREDTYKITKDGQIWSNYSKKFLSVSTSKQGYKRVTLSTNNRKAKKYFVHRLVMITYCPIENMENLQINHIDGNKANNNITNLEWVTPSKNIIHSYETGLNQGKVGETNSMAIHTEDFIKKIIQLILDGKTNTEIEILTNYNAKEVSKIRNKQRWTYLTKDLEFPKVKRKRLR